MARYLQMSSVQKLRDSGVGKGDVDKNSGYCGGVGDLDVTIGIRRETRPHKCFGNRKHSASRKWTSGRSRAISSQPEQVRCGGCLMVVLRR